MDSQRVNGARIPPKPPQNYHLHDFLPKILVTVPSLKLLPLTLLAAISVRDAVPGLTLANDSCINRGLRKH